MNKVKRIKILFLVLTLLIITSNVAQYIYADSLSDFQICVDILNASYFGAYSGESTNGIPNGAGTFSFESDDDYNSFILNGTWENGQLQGDVTINYKDNSKLIGNYSKGLLTGTVTKVASNGTYETFSVNRGRPYGLISKYNTNNEIDGYDYFYQFDKISELKANSEFVDYHYLLAPNIELMVKPLKLICNVDALYESDDSVYVKLKDSEDNIYIGTYTNSIANKFKQAIVPNLCIGDKIIAYGYFQQYSSLNNVSNIGNSILASDYNGKHYLPSFSNTLSAESLNIDPNKKEWPSDYDLDLTNYLPIIRLFAADYVGAVEFNVLDASDAYENIIQYPYHFSGMGFNKRGTIVSQIIDADSNSVHILFEEDNSKSIYYATFSLSDQTTLPGLGERVHIDGIYQGISKILYRDIDSIFPKTYVLYPSLLINAISLL